MEPLLPDRLKALWREVDERQLGVDAFTREQERLLGAHRQMWERALSLDGSSGLAESLLAELGSYTQCADPGEIQRRCLDAVATLKKEWLGQVDPSDRTSIERFYDASQATIYELMWWHTLREDNSPLAYVTALQLAQQRGCHRYLDFGAGVGSGAILFARHGFEVTLADISSTLLRFSEWRLGTRQLPASSIDLKVDRLPHRAFDFVTAMDVFEHLVDPVETVDHLADALEPGGFLFARITAESDAERPQHIVQDFSATFARLRALGLVEVWQDEWLWGHRAFQKV